TFTHPSRIYGRPTSTTSGPSRAFGRPVTPGRPTPTDARTTDHDRTSDKSTPEPNLWTSDEHRTSGPSRASGRPVTPGRPTPMCCFVLGRSPCTPS
uniref:Uncharacterized protein n=1 Tax=Triticum urartu TaxID=4572 RepID=A0A8R7V5Y0_TRIUA